MKRALQKTYTLNNGIVTPAVGLGTGGINKKEPIVKAVLENGYRHLDCATVM